MVVVRGSWASWVVRHAFLIFVYAMLVILAATMIFPYVWMIANSLKAEIDFYQHPYSIIPEVFTLETYKVSLVGGKVGLYMRNSALYATSTVVFSLLFDSLAAYAFARYQFPGREQAFTALLATMMLPGSVTLIPSFLVANYLGLTNTYLGVVLPGFADAFGIFLLRQFLLNVPKELGDAARIDGAGFFGIYWRIMLPMVKPALITLGIFNFLWQWNSFIWPLIVLSDWKKYPITVGIATFRGQYQTEWPTLFAATTAVSVPVFILFFLAQEYIVGGISLSGLKG